MKVKMLAILSLFALATQVLAAANYPVRPDRRLTPGKFCEPQLATEYRYQEQIPYCARDVSSELKDEIFQSYRRLGFSLNSVQRSDYKIDHYIPLCLGGSNDKANLWPQHVSVYSITDSIEALSCEKLQQNRISRRDAVTVLLTVKNDLSKAKEAMKYLRSL
ncbi:HNH endonuclease signature motif containing protein [Peredibacter starrii]|uniref:HNH endonuclease signature motif containing protein n=1 Tax=Peredibacter starrii TaxID=28202 RepID=A0AAX4HUY4_9BACT|nr:HNH endonuclease signature motif containing protein [Peredibacter starrii]WPU66759.1 HNH endonuclease signature motif containing protein [Peredibacter starrii]